MEVEALTLHKPSNGDAEIELFEERISWYVWQEVYVNCELIFDKEKLIIKGEHIIYDVMYDYDRTSFVITPEIEEKYHMDPEEIFDEKSLFMRKLTGRKRSSQRHLPRKKSERETLYFNNYAIKDARESSNKPPMPILQENVSA